MAGNRPFLVASVAATVWRCGLCTREGRWRAGVPLCSERVAFKPVTTFPLKAFIYLSSLFLQLGGGAYFLYQTVF